MQFVTTTYFVFLFLTFYCDVCNCQERDKNKGVLIGELSQLEHQVSGTVWAVDENTLYLENFNYDGTAPDAFFWMGTEAEPSDRGIIIPYPTGKNEVLGRFKNQNVILHLPTGKKIADFKWFSVWCRKFAVDFGHVSIPARLELPQKHVLPEFKRLAHKLRSGNITILDAKTFFIPNLYYDGAGPDAFFLVGNGSEPNKNGRKVPNEEGSYDVLKGYQGKDITIELPGDITVYDIDYLSMYCIQFTENFGHVLLPSDQTLFVPPALGQNRIQSQDFDNCLELNDNLQVEWLAGQFEVQIKITGAIDEDQYMAFGISFDPNSPVMIGSDVVVAFYNRQNDSFHAVDYTMLGKSQCDGTSGACPDERVSGRNDATLIGGKRMNGITSIVFSRPYETNEQSLDIPIKKNEKVTVVAAIGKLNTLNEASYHHQFSIKETKKIDFGSKGDNSCTKKLVTEEVPKDYKPWTITRITNTYNFTVNIGPTGGDRGYKVITGFPSWGISFWINDLLIPEIYVERGQTYTFNVETGDDDTIPAKYHPFYITEDVNGGLHQKTEENKNKENIIAGVKRDSRNDLRPTAIGRLCEYQHIGIARWKESETFSEFKKTLKKTCKKGSAGSLIWTVQEDTPDVVYYQCYTHRNLGWKIHVLDKGQQLPPLNSGSSSNLCMWLIVLVVASVFV